MVKGGGDYVEIQLHFWCVGSETFLDLYLLVKI